MFLKQLCCSSYTQCQDIVGNELRSFGKSREMMHRPCHWLKAGTLSSLAAKGDCGHFAKGLPADWYRVLRAAWESKVFGRKVVLWLSNALCFFLLVQGRKQRSGLL